MYLIFSVRLQLVGGADIRLDRALEKYIGTLHEIVEADYSRGWPGHRSPIDDPTARAEYIIDHHEERSWRVLNALRQHGPCDTWTVSATLFGALEDIHILHGPGESDAHLQHLERDGLVVREENEYRLEVGVVERLDNYDDKRWPLESER